MPAAAVIPAPIAYTNVVAVKKLVVGFLSFSRLARPFKDRTAKGEKICLNACVHLTVDVG